MWLINNQIIFNPAQRTLKDAENQIQLNNSAARCLALFLQHPGEVISHEALLDEGWRSQGVHVTDNSLRQMLSTLRRYFAQLQVDGEAFVTVHRQGYRLHESVQVTACQTEAVRAQPAAVVTPAILAATTSDGAPVAEFHASPMPAHSAAAAPSRHYRAVTSRRRINRLVLVWRGMLIAAAIVMLSLLLGMKVLELRDVVDVNYSHFRTIADRYWYIQDDFNTAERAEVDENIRQLTNQLAKFVQLEEEERYVYINRTQLIDRFSWFICHNPIEQKDASCRSVISFDAE